MKIFSDDTNLYIKFSILERILGVHWSFSIPLEDILEKHNRKPVQTYREIRIPGTFFPGIIKAGTYRNERGWEFWYVTRRKKYLTVELRRGFYKRIILSVDENQGIVN